MSNRRFTEDLTGEKINAWTVLGKGDKTSSGSTRWICRCDCGTIRQITTTSLRKGTSKGCHACLWDRMQHPRAHTDGSRRWVDNKKTHIYSSWLAMKQRCNKPNNKAYKNYGGRGIKVCDEWDADFQAYFDYVSKLDHYGEEGYTLDRIDNDGNYEPGNVRYCTKGEQERNKRAKRLIDLQLNSFSTQLKEAISREKVSRKQLAKEMNVGYYTVSKWINGKCMPCKERREWLMKRFSIGLE